MKRTAARDRSVAVWGVTQVDASPAPAGRGGSCRGLARTSWIAIAAIGAALAALSLSRMPVYAVYANERDAVRTLRQLADRAETDGGAWAVDASLRSLVGDGAPDPAGAHWSAGGELLRRNGYLFGLATDAAGDACLQAWPWRHAETGRAAYAIGPDLELRAHPNGDGAWSGPDARPTADVDNWLEVAGALRRY